MAFFSVSFNPLVEETYYPARGVDPPPEPPSCRVEIEGDSAEKVRELLEDGFCSVIEVVEINH